MRSYCKRLAPQSSSASSDQAVAVDEHLGAPSGGGGRRVEASLRPVARRRAAVAGPRAADGTTTTLAPPRWRSGQPLLHRAKRAANKSCTPYGDCFSAMAARSVGVHLSGGAILTCAEPGATPVSGRCWAWWLQGGGSSRRGRTRSLRLNARLWQPKAGYLADHPCSATKLQCGPCEPAHTKWVRCR